MAYCFCSKLNKKRLCISPTDVTSAIKNKVYINCKPKYRNQHSLQFYVTQSLRAHGHATQPLQLLKQRENIRIRYLSSETIIFGVYKPK